MIYRPQGQIGLSGVCRARGEPGTLVCAEGSWGGGSGTLGHAEPGGDRSLLSLHSLARGRGGSEGGDPKGIWGPGQAPCTWHHLTGISRLPPPGFPLSRCILPSLWASPHPLDIPRVLPSRAEVRAAPTTPLLSERSVPVVASGAVSPSAAGHSPLREQEPSVGLCRGRKEVRKDGESPPGAPATSPRDPDAPLSPPSPPLRHPQPGRPLPSKRP